MLSMNFGHIHSKGLFFLKNIVLRIALGFRLLLLLLSPKDLFLSLKLLLGLKSITSCLALDFDILNLGLINCYYHT
jgi:hypothetical protein